MVIVTGKIYDFLFSSHMFACMPIIFNLLCFHNITSNRTHVAGTMAAIQGNGKGVVGVVRSGQMPLRIGKGLQDSGSGSTANVLLAMKDCVTDGTANGGKVVVNMSLGSGSFTTSVDEYLKELDDAGTNVLFVAAAGNNGSSSYSYPASYDRGVMMSVAAVDSNNAKASFSQVSEEWVKH